jgi:signal transduction histidine kinase
MLSQWLDKTEADKVKDEHVWTRVENRLPGSEDRKLYDVVGSYQKGNSDGVDTVLITVDRTTHYSKDEEDMDFIALAAHELRGPITVIRGYLDVLSDELQETLQGDQSVLLERLSVSASRLSGYVNNILNVSRYDRRHLKLHLREDRLQDVYSTIADDLQLRARTQNRLLAVNFPNDLPTIAADRNSLSEVIANLADNAIKYSHEGGQAIVTAKVEGDFVVCMVEDQGMGIPGSLIGNLFTKFYRSHRSRSTVSGTGLGLYICKAIVESHGGQIGVRSREGEGSTFYFTIPIYSTVADKLLASNNENEGIIESSNGWIKNHSLYRG